MPPPPVAHDAGFRIGLPWVRDRGRVCGSDARVRICFRHDLDRGQSAERPPLLGPGAADPPQSPRLPPRAAGGPGVLNRRGRRGRGGGRHVLGSAAVHACNLYFEPPRESWLGGWHRDCQYDKFDLRPDADTERIVLSEAVPAREVHMRLCDSAATEIVPGSHKWDTPRSTRSASTTIGRTPYGRQPIDTGDLAFFHVNSSTAVCTAGASVARRHLGDRVTAAARHPRGHELARRLRRQLSAVVRRSGLPAGHRPGRRETFERFTATYRDSWDESFMADLNPELRRFFAARLAED